MQKLTANDPETKSADLTAENVAKLKALFPELVTEDGVNVDVLKQLVGQTVTDAEEKYGLNWHGKRKARQLALTPSTGTLRPCPEDSVAWDTTQNLMIEGDNLEVLKLLQKSYAGKVKLIYIDPPYNTGKDFVYPDNFQDNIKNYLELTGQTGDGGKKLSSNTEASGRFHTDWLNMMYPRLKLAVNLLRKDGVIFISIDDNEIANLRKACDEIFGPENFLGIACRVSKKANNQGDYWSPNFDYVLTYAKAKSACPPFFGGVNYEAYDQVEVSGERKGEKFQLVRLYMTSLDPMRGCDNQRYYIEAPDGTLLIPPGNTFPAIAADGESVPPETGDDKVWRWAKSSYLASKDRIVVKRVRSSNLVNKDGGEVKWNVFTKTYLNDVIKDASAKPNSLIEDHINQNSSHELNELGVPFSFAKPSSLIGYLCEISRASGDDLVMDFFAGSGTTGHAVFAAKASGKSDLRFLLVQLPEWLDPEDKDQKEGARFCEKLGKPRNIAELTKERLRRAGVKIREEWQERQDKEKNGIEKEGTLALDASPIPPVTSSSVAPDIGFRVFKLASSNIRAWEPDRENLAETLEASVDHLKTDRSESDILFELLLKLGLDLTVPIETRTIAGQQVHSIGAGTLLVCLSKSITAKEVEPLALGMAAWHKAQAPAGESTVVFRDSAFPDDVAKTNLTAILEQHGLKNVRSL